MEAMRPPPKKQGLSLSIDVEFKKDGKGKVPCFDDIVTPNTSIMLDYLEAIQIQPERRGIHLYLVKSQIGWELQCVFKSHQKCFREGNKATTGATSHLKAAFSLWLFGMCVSDSTYGLAMQSTHFLLGRDF